MMAVAVFCDTLNWAVHDKDEEKTVRIKFLADRGKMNRMKKSERIKIKINRPRLDREPYA